MAALREVQDELVAVASQVASRGMVGIAAYRPAESGGNVEDYVFDSLGMTGLPLVPCHTFPSDAKAAFFSLHALRDAELPSRLAALIATGAAVLITDGLAAAMADMGASLDAPNVHVLPIAGKPKSLLTLDRDALAAIRQPMLEPLGISFDAPNQVALYVFDDGSWVVENFNDDPVTATLDGRAMTIPARGWEQQWLP